MKKRMIALALSAALLAALSLCACTGAGEDDPHHAALTESPTDSPIVTDAPIDTEAAGTAAPELTEPHSTEEPAATDEPKATMSPSNGFEWKELYAGEPPASVDIDFDGGDDTVRIREESVDQWSSDYYIEITTAARPDETFSRKVEEALWYNAVVLNPDPGSGYMYVVSSFGVESGDSCTYIHYADPTSGEIVELESWDLIGSYDDGEYLHDGKAIFQSRTEIMGTDYLFAQYELSPEGPVFAGDAYYYQRYYWDGGFKPVITEDDDGVVVIKKIGVSLTDENGGIVGSAKLHKGDRIWPLRTDGKSFVIARTEDGREVRIDFVIPEGEFIPYMDGYPQDTFFDVFYYD